VLLSDPAINHFVADCSLSTEEIWRIAEGDLLDSLERGQCGLAELLVARYEQCRHTPIATTSAPKYIAGRSPFDVILRGEVSTTREKTAPSSAMPKTPPSSRNAALVPEASPS